MMNPAGQSRISILSALLLIISATVVTVTGAFTLILVHYRTSGLIAEADAELLTAAEMIRELHGTGYHDRITDAASVSEEHFRRIVAKNDELCRRLNLQYLWSVLLVNDRLVFTSATHVDPKDPNSPCAAFFESHRDPRSFAAALTPGAGPTFSSFHNEWGEGRQVLIPWKDAHGRTCIFGASTQLTRLRSMVRRTILNSIGIGLTVLCGALLVTLAVGRSLVKPIASLTKAAGRMVQGDLHVPLKSSRIMEIQELENAFDQMRRQLQRDLAALRESESKNRALLNALPDLMFLFDGNGVFLDYHAPEAEPLLLAPELFVGRSVRNALDPGLAELTMTHLTQVITGGQSSSYRYEVKINGETRIYESRMVPCSENKALAIVRDITGQEHYKKILTQREEYLRTILQTAVDGFLVIDGKGKLVEVNDSYCRMSGYTRDELLQFRISDVEAVETAAETSTRIERIRSKEYEIFVTRHRKKDGGYLDLEISVNFLGLEGGKFICFCRDLTERKEREDRIALLGRMLDVAPAAITIHDTGGTFLFANKMTWELHGYSSKDAFMALSLRDLDVPESAAMLAERVRLISEQGEARFEVAHYRRDGSIFPLEVLAKEIEWEGRPAILSIAADITARKQAEAALRESEELFRKFLEEAPDGVYMNDLEGNFLYGNRKAEEIIGYSREELIGRNFLELPILAESSLPRAAELLQANIEDQSTGPDELELIARDGRRIPVEINTSVTHHSGKKIVLAFVRDTTERKKSEKALRNSEAEYRALYEGAAIGIFHSTFEGRFLDVNPALAKMLGYSSPPEVLNSIYNIAEQIYASPPKRDQIITDLLAQGKTVTLENRYRRKNGEEWDAFLHLRYVVDEQGKPKHLEGFVEDITERKLAENLLRESEARFKALHNASFGGIAIHDRGVIIDCNQGLAEMTGYSLNELIGMNGLLLIAEKSRKLVMDNISSGYEKPYEAFGLRKNGEAFPIRLEARNIPYEGRQVRTVEFRDITEAKKAEEERTKLQAQLLQSQKMESVGRLAGGVAHDFNNMLMIIIGNAEMALDETEPSAPLAAHLQEIMASARRSADLTRQLLAFARKQTVSPRVLDLNEVVSGMIKMLQRLIGEDIDLVWKPSSRLWPVNMDPSQIDQILVNLAVNARDAITGVGNLTIETENAVFDETDCMAHAGLIPGEYVRLSVSDTGCGMGQETIEHLFEPFYTTKEVGKGTGLGLATVYGIVRQNDGFIHVHSEPGHGTTFKIHIPRTQAAAETAPQESGRKPAGGTETVLLVEDEPAILKLAQAILERYGYTVLAARTPREAREIAGSHPDPIHLLITDVVMPQMNGRDLLESIATLRPEIRVLFMSGYTADVIAHHGVLDEGIHFLQKPFSVRTLSAAVRDVLDREEALETKSF
ncbi:MAG: PAS domain S-box protein [Thermodesulfobacteriota bacterium]